MTSRSVVHWPETTFGRLARIGNGADYRGVEVEHGGHPVYGSGGEFRRASSYLFDGESVLFGRKGTVDRPLYVSGKFWTVDTIFYSVIDRSRLLPRFAYYWATTLPFRAWATDTALPSMTSSAIKAAPITLPPIMEQRAIADYLDRETAQIDAFIAKNEELIALLTERLGAMVDGVMAELGFAEPDDLAISREYPLPESWRIISLGSLLLQLTNGYVGPTRDILVDDGIRYIQGTHIKKGKIDFLRRPFFVAREWHDERPRIHLREGDVLIVQTGDIGKVAVVPPGFGEASCHALQIARVNRRIIDPQFLGAYLSSRFGYHQLTSRATGALHLHLEASIKSAPVVVPPLHVQAQIVREVRERESQIESAIGTAERLIALSKERRAALISAAVTGKVDVRGAA